MGGKKMEKSLIVNRQMVATAMVNAGGKVNLDVAGIAVMTGSLPSRPQLATCPLPTLKDKGGKKDKKKKNEKNAERRKRTRGRNERRRGKVPLRVQRPPLPRTMGGRRERTLRNARLIPRALRRPLGNVVASCVEIVVAPGSGFFSFGSWL